MPTGRQTRHYHVVGMTCHACAVLIRQKLRRLEGVAQVDVQEDQHALTLTTSGPVSDQALNEALRPLGYSLTPLAAAAPSPAPATGLQTLGGLLMVGAAVFWLSQLDLMPKGLAFSPVMGLGAVAGLGLLASVSTCMATTGALVLLMGGRMAQMAAVAPARRLWPFVWFSAGRVGAYGLLGAALGALGGAARLSFAAGGALTLAVSLLMVAFGLGQLGLLPKPRWFAPHRFAALGVLLDRCVDGRHPAASAGLGALTFVLPCGFTQALQLFALSLGDPVRSGALLGVFALGTLPGVLGVGAVSAFAGKGGRSFFGAVAAVLVVALGAGGLGSGLRLMGVDIQALWPARRAAAAPPVPARLENGRQVVNMTVAGLDYSPSRFAVQRGVPVTWRINARRAAGCAQVIELPAIGIRQLLSPEADTVVQFTPPRTGEMPFFCGMGMTTPGAAFVVQAGPLAKVAKPPTAPKPPPPPKPKAKAPCQPGQACYVQRRKARLLWGGAFTPKLIQVQKDVPVELTVQTSFQPFGCLSGILIKDLGVFSPVKKGNTVLTFTPDKTGSFPVMCGMEMIHYADLEVSP